MRTLLLFCYKILTSIICVLGILREKCEWYGNKKQRVIRFDRTLPWVKGQPKNGIWWSCCDCGLTHFFACGHSGTPARPAEYDYKWRFGRKGHTEPDLELGAEAHAKFMKFEQDVLEGLGE